MELEKLNKKLLEKLKKALIGAKNNDFVFCISDYGITKLEWSEIEEVVGKRFAYGTTRGIYRISERKSVDALVARIDEAISNKEDDDNAKQWSVSGSIMSVMGGIATIILVAFTIAKCS